ncbi:MULTISPECIES: hypothetical protein [unclassified Porphyromonas]|nr:MULTISPECIES: hypothetical protein [unclassified Porphyromonas]
MHDVKATHHLRPQALALWLEAWGHLGLSRTIHLGAMSEGVRPQTE